MSMRELLLSWMLGVHFLLLFFLLLRAFGRRRMSSRFLYGLWLIVLVRALLPFSFPAGEFGFMRLFPQEIFREKETVTEGKSDFSMLEKQEKNFSNANGNAILENGEERSTFSKEVKEEIVEKEENGRVSDLEKSIKVRGKEEQKGADIQEEKRTMEQRAGYDFWKLLIYFWGIGSCVCFLGYLCYGISLHRSLSKHRKIFSNAYLIPVWKTSVFPSPCLFGLIKPGIYLPENLEEESDGRTKKIDLSCILAHELCHYRRKDMLWNFFRNLCRVLWWWSPLVWIAAKCSVQDGELACDEEVLASFDEAQRVRYTETLLGVLENSLKDRKHLFSMTTAMSKNAQEIKERMVYMMRGKQKGKYLQMGVLFLVLAGLFCSCAGGNGNMAKESSLKKQSAEASKENRSDTGANDSKASVQGKETLEAKTDADELLAYDDYSNQIDEEMVSAFGWKKRENEVMEKESIEATLSYFFEDMQGTKMQEKAWEHGYLESISAAVYKPVAIRKGKKKIRVYVKVLWKSYGLNPDLQGGNLSKNHTQTVSDLDMLDFTSTVAELSFKDETDGFELVDIREFSSMDGSSQNTYDSLSEYEKEILGNSAWAKEELEQKCEEAVNRKIADGQAYMFGNDTLRLLLEDDAEEFRYYYGKLGFRPEKLLVMHGIIFEPGKIKNSDGDADIEVLKHWAEIEKATSTYSCKIVKKKKNSFKLRYQFTGSGGDLEDVGKGEKLMDGIYFMEMEVFMKPKKDAVYAADGVEEHYEASKKITIVRPDGTKYEGDIRELTYEDLK